MIAYTPRAASGTVPGPVGFGKAGLPASEPINNAEATSMTTVTAAQSTSPTGQSGAVLPSEADRLVGGAGVFLVIDDTAMPRKGRHSVGVAPQYASSLGKNANCRTLVSVTLASHEVPVMVGLHLFLPESWTSDPERMAKAKVPADRQVALTKPEIAIEEIDRIRAAGVRFGCVLADAGYGMSASFRQALSACSLSWAVGIPGRQKVYPADVAMIFPVAGHGRPRQHHIPDSKPLAAEKLSAEQAWRSVS